MFYNPEVDFSELKGKTLVSVVINDDADEITFETSDGIKYIMFHDQDCCESVTIDDFDGEIENLLNTPILLADVSCNDDEPKDAQWPDESYTWTFYRLATIKGYVTIRWYGASNGDYSESVSFKRIVN